jgi:mannitol/fructose-specific phosphotransferase system IIA component (Ntr-type)
MLLCQTLRRDLIKIGLEAETKREAIEELVDLLLQQHEISLRQRDALIEAVWESERQNGSGMEQGIAVPHARTDRVEDILCALGTAPQGIPFDTRDGKPADLVILLLIPHRNFTGEVRTLSGIQVLLQHPGLKQQIVAAPTPEAALEIIRSRELCPA